MRRGAAGLAASRDGKGQALLVRSDRGRLSNKASSALEGDVAPQPGYGDNETIPEAN